MSAVARLNDPILGSTSGEHSGHTDPPHGSVSITGSIVSGCSPSVYVNGKPVARVGAVTEEFDSCCGSSNGVVSKGSPTVFVNGIPMSRVGDSITPHNGTATISGGSPNVFSN